MPDQLDQPLNRSRSRWMRWFHPARASRSDGFGRFAEATARFMGSPKFVLYMTVFVVAWIAANMLLAMNEVATRDFVRSELRDVLEELLTEERRSREEIVGELMEELSEEPDGQGTPPRNA